ncbi:hypothetical protein LVY72_22100 [Arthrobacter sp. I2-34]|uniref:Alkaline shock response membrane anchor protein AmaP n=1 Tax=Arthrobacter hankyongi TaxID=2904801 RepID=A0ABS9LD25_9MICC|nr:hypothetical protein [Arthrobacter hankyongi]MCG2624587.1 hypothetical protein [Arthrobacter hankyongi]
MTQLRDDTARDSLRAGLVRREMHSSRAPASLILAFLLAALCLYVLLEVLLEAIGQPPWLLDPRGFAAWLNQLPDNASPLVLGASGTLILLAGLVFFLQGVLPGRLHRHLLPSRRGIVVVDDEVIAAALARRARLAANVTREQVLVTVTRSTVEVQLRPTSGRPVSEVAIQAAVEDELARTGIEPVPLVTVRVSASGVVGQ